MITNMEWYRVFYTVARTGNVSRAAEELFISQPAVSHTLKLLEKELGGQLFFRSSRGVSLTGEGEVLFRYIEQAYRLMEAGEQRIGEMHELTAGEIHIGAGDTLCRHVLLPVLETFREAYPGVQISVTNRTTSETAQLLKSGRIDFGLVHLPLPPGDGQLDVREGRAIQDCFVAGSRYAGLASREEPLSWEEISRQPLILLEPGTSTRRHLDRHAERVLGEPLKPQLELGSMDLLVEFARGGMGLACVVRDFIRGELAAGGVRELTVNEPIPPRQVGIATLKGVPVSAAAQRLLGMLEASFT